MLQQLILVKIKKNNIFIKSFREWNIKIKIYCGFPQNIIYSIFVMFIFIIQVHYALLMQIASSPDFLLREN